jgi:hypothetical protein
MSLGTRRVRSSQFARIAGIVFPCVLACVLQVAVFSSFLVLRPTESIVPEITGMMFIGYFVGLATIDFRLIFLFSPLIVGLACIGWRRWAVLLLMTNYLFGFILYLMKHQGLDWSKVFTYETVVVYLKVETFVFHLFPLVLLHVIYYWALRRKNPLKPHAAFSNGM